MKTLLISPENELDDSHFGQIVRLKQSIWPDKSKTDDELVSAMKAGRGPGNHSQVILIHEDDHLLAHAKIFPRVIGTRDGPLTVLALSAVCVTPHRRGEGLGAQLVRRAFMEIDSGLHPLCLYQTGVPGFYQKLGAVLITNRFYNSLNTANPEANPWWDPWVMIYPATVPWTKDPIDLLGGGY